MIVMVLPAWLLALLPGLFGGMINATLSQGQINRMNRYNDPRSQLQRLNAAGLPFAAFAAGQAGQQSNLPDTSGVGGAFTDFMSNYQTVKQGELLREQIRKMAAEADLAKILADLKGEEADYFLNSGEMVPDGFGGYIQRSNAYLATKRDDDMKYTAQKLLVNQEEISEIEKRIKRSNEPIEKAKAVKELDLLLQKLSFGKLQLENERVRTVAKNTIIHHMEKGGLNLFEAILITIGSSLGGGIRSPYGNIGF